jgi:hypothetical protein
VNFATDTAMRELLAKAVDAVADGDFARALAALDLLGQLLQPPAVKPAATLQARKPPAERQKPKAKRLRCGECGYFFKQPDRLAEHRRQHHPELA